MLSPVLGILPKCQNAGVRKRSHDKMSVCGIAHVKMSGCEIAQSRNLHRKIFGFQKVWRRLGGGVLDSTQTKKCGAGGEGGRSRFPEPEKVWRR